MELDRAEWMKTMGHSSELDNPFIFRLGEEWRKWRVDDPEWKSHESADEEVKNGRTKHLKHVEKRIGARGSC